MKTLLFLFLLIVVVIGVISFKMHHQTAARKAMKPKAHKVLSVTHEDALLHTAEKLEALMKKCDETSKKFKTQIN